MTTSSRFAEENNKKKPKINKINKNNTSWMATMQELLPNISLNKEMAET
jgi:hypothetical protein